jgi:hypothetical protein
MELSCGPPAAAARHTRNDTVGASCMPPQRHCGADLAPPARRAGRLLKRLVSQQLERRPSWVVKEVWEEVDRQPDPGEPMERQGYQERRPPQTDAPETCKGDKKGDIDEDEAYDM